MEVTTLLQDAVNSIDLTINFHTVVEISANRYGCYTTNTKWVMIENKIVLNGVEYKVESYSLNEFLELSGASIPSTGSQALNIKRGKSIVPFSPYFTHGKLKAVNAKVADVKKDSNILPMLWNFELQPRTLPADLDTIFESEGSVRIFFLNSTNPKQYETETDYQNSIFPLTNLVDEFLVALRKQKRAGKFFVSNRINHSKFTTGGGDTNVAENYVLGKFLSGIEIEVDLPVLKSLICPVKVFPEGGAFSSGFSSGFKID